MNFTCDNPNDETIADYRSDDDHRKCQSPEEVNVRPRGGGGGEGAETDVGDVFFPCVDRAEIHIHHPIIIINPFLRVQKFHDFTFENM